MQVIFALNVEEWSLVAKMVLACLGVIGAWCAYGQLKIGNSLRTTKLIDSMYDAFTDKDKDDLCAFYDRIRNGATIAWKGKDAKGKKEERLLNISLTLFDKIGYLQTQSLLRRVWFFWPAATWEYLAFELQRFAENPSVQEYIDQRNKDDARNGNYPYRILPFTGFRELYNGIPRRFRGRDYRKFKVPK